MSAGYDARAALAVVFAGDDATGARWTCANGGVDDEFNPKAVAGAHSQGVHVARQRSGPSRMIIEVPDSIADLHDVATGQELEGAAPSHHILTVDERHGSDQERYLTARAWCIGGWIKRHTARDAQLAAEQRAAQCAA